MQTKKSTKQKRIEGTFRADRDQSNPLEFLALTNLPNRDQGSEFANHYFQNVGNLLISKKLLTGADLTALERASGWFHIYETSRVQILQDKFIQVAASGYSNISGYLTSYEKAHKYLSEFEGQFGLNPLSRQKIGMPQDTEDELDLLLK
jgi:phage terminase small subunit